MYKRFKQTIDVAALLIKQWEASTKVYESMAKEYPPGSYEAEDFATLADFCEYLSYMAGNYLDYEVDMAMSMSRDPIRGIDHEQNDDS